MNKDYLKNVRDWSQAVDSECYHKITEPESYPCIAIWYDDPGGHSDSGASHVNYVYPEDFNEYIEAEKSEAVLIEYENSLGVFRRLMQDSHEKLEADEATKALDVAILKQAGLVISDRVNAYVTKQHRMIEEFESEHGNIEDVKRNAMMTTLHQMKLWADGDPGCADPEDS